MISRQTMTKALLAFVAALSMIALQTRAEPSQAGLGDPSRDSITILGVRGRVVM